MSSKSNAIHAAIVDALIQIGTPATEGSTEYGFLAEDYIELRMHMAGCRPAYAQCAWDDITWREFAGTLDPPDEKTGIDLTVTCTCGLVQGRRWRYSGGYAELIRAMTGG